MNKNKGFIGIGLIIAIILGIVVVGGGAYYLGKSGSKQEVKSPENILPIVDNQNLPVVDSSQQVNVANPTNPVVATGCTSSSVPSIKVLSPNGGETYTAGQKITVKWSSCNLLKTTPVQILLEANFSSQPWNSAPMSNFILSDASILNSGSATFTLPSSDSSKWTGNIANMKYGSYYKIYVSQDLSDAIDASDMSDNSFTINSTSVLASQKCIDEATSLLPAYILKQGDYLDFKLNKITFFALKSDASGAQYFTGNPTNDACMVNVNYSVKLKAGAMNAGNGQESSDGWIINKSGYATIDKNSSGYYIVSMGTGY